MTEDGNKVPLSYARPGTRTFRHPRWRLILLCAVPLITAFLAWQYGPDAWLRIKFLYWQHQWATCIMPRETVIFDTQSQGPVYRDPLTGEFIADMVGYYPPCRRTFPVLPGTPPSGTIFLHKLKSPAGSERIVCIDVTGFDVVYQDRRSRRIRLHLTSYQPRRYPTGVSGGSSGWVIDCRPIDRLRFFAGQPDPKDPAHFTFRYEHNGITGTFDCYLQKDGSIRLVPDRGTGGGPDPWGGWSPQPATRPSPRRSP